MSKCVILRNVANCVTKWIKVSLMGPALATLVDTFVKCVMKNLCLAKSIYCDTANDIVKCDQFNVGIKYHKLKFNYNVTMN